MDLFKEIEKIYIKIEEFLGEESLNIFISSNHADLWCYHFGLGTWIRNHLLQDNDCLYFLFIENGITSKDDMSSLIIRLFHGYQQTKEKSHLP